MANDHIIIKGIPVPAGQASGIRKEISTWATEKPEESIQVSLFIRALQKLFDTPYTDRLSFFQIAGTCLFRLSEDACLPLAGIHGYPGDARWDNSDKPANTGSDWTHYVYCTHNMITFPTWHRPYMLLFEVGNKSVL